MERIMEKMHEARLQRNKLRNNAQTTPPEHLKFRTSNQNLSWLTGGVVLGALVVTMIWLIGGGDDAKRQDVAVSIPEQRHQLIGLPVQSTSMEDMMEGLVNLTEQVQTLTASFADLKNTLLDIRTESDSVASLSNESESNGFQEQVKMHNTAAVLETLPTPAAGVVDAGISEETDAGMTGGTNNSMVAAPIEHTPAFTKTQKRETDRDDGPWVINLASLPQKNKAERFVEKARSKGIDAELSQVTVRGKEYWRAHVSGFATAAEANIKANEIKEKLGLKDAWIAKN
jgi:cell division septation protein DedD